MRLHRSRSLLAAAVAIAAVALVGCIPLPPSVVTTTVPQGQGLPTAPPTTGPQPTIVPVAPSAPITPSTTPPSTPPSTTPTEPEGPVEGDVGLLWAGDADGAADGGQADAPSPTYVEPTRGTPTSGSSSPWGEQSSATDFMTDTQVTSDGNLVLTTTGMLVTLFDDNTYGTCSATVVNSPSQNVAVTAAHCLWDTANQQSPNTVMFVPGGNLGSAPFGTWYAQEWWYPGDFEAGAGVDEAGNTQGEAWSTDFAFVRFYDDDAGNRIEDYTGGQGVSFTGEVSDLLVVGYPGTDQWNRSRLYCSTSTPTFGLTFWPHFTLECDVQPGSSGGPFLTDVDSDSGAGYVVGVVSTVGTHTSGTPLGSLAEQLYDTATG